MSAQPGHGDLRDKPGAWVDLGLTLPLFLAYHLGVIFLKVQNATDPVTGPLLSLAEGNRPIYLLITASIGVVFAGVFAMLGRGQAFRPAKFVQIAIEGFIYAILMRVGAAYVVGRMFAAVGSPAPEAVANQGPFVGFVMSLGAGFYEELAFRVILFGLGAKVLVWLFTKQPYGVVVDGPRRLTWRGFLVALLWSVAAAAVFSGVHYIGALGDPFQLPSFTFRLVLGLVLTLIFVLRGFAAAVWAHALYDVWVLVFPS